MDQNRIVTGTGLDADYNINTYFAGLRAGMPLKVNKDAKSHAFISPYVAVGGGITDAENYTESGGGGLSLNVSQKNYYTGYVQGGAEYHTVYTPDNTTEFIPSIDLAGSYYFGDDSTEITGNYIGGGSSFNFVGTKSDRLFGNLGLAAMYRSKKGPGKAKSWSMSARYDADLSSNFTSHAFKLEGRLEF